ncbi:hypothetical protein CDCA_CDCA02G0696 [Cyanidium caldarium]|uniref:WW domain-containing protein n=1 Tax=Cyanidium caldarium TaxID=2771 RepID=A0AAV9IRH3_CYACA|nr:hypothetical protein CDCA_CDCA02G0696 [Cyanidium caldarium]
MPNLLHSAKILFLSSTQRAGLDEGDVSEVQTEWDLKLRRALDNAEEIERGLSQVNPAWKAVVRSVKSTCTSAKVVVSEGTGRKKKQVEDTFNGADEAYLEFVHASEEAAAQLEGVCGRELFTGGTTLAHVLSEVRQYIESCRTLINYIGKDVNSARLEFDHYYNKCERLSERARERRVNETALERLVRNRVKLERSRDRYVARKRNYIDSARAHYYKYPVLARSVLAAVWSYQMSAAEALQEVTDTIEDKVSANVETAKALDIHGMSANVPEEDRKVEIEAPELPLTSYEAAKKFESQRPHVPLPAGWEERVDPATGRRFYISHVEKTTSWEPPTPPQYEKAIKAPKGKFEPVTPSPVRV